MKIPELYGKLYPNDVPQEVETETPTEHHAWFRPFYKAIASQLVDGRLPHGTRPITGGTVSEHP